MSDPISAAALAPSLKVLLQKARAYGADQADAIATHGRSLGVSVREGALEDVDNSEGKDIGLRVMVGKRQACVSSSDLSDISLDVLAERAVAMAKLAPEDPYCGLPSEAELATDYDADALDVYDPTLITPADLKARAIDVERATLAVKGVAQAEGAQASANSSAIWFMNSHGFSGGWRASRHGISVSAIAEKDGQMERDYDYDSTRYLDDLRSLESVGRLAGERAVSRVGSRQMQSASLPVIFDRRVSGALVSALIGAINGASITRGVSFLKDRMGEALFANDITITDNPKRARGDGSRPFDGEGLPVGPRHIIENGRLQTWLLNLASARQLDLTPTGHGSRGLGSPPGVSATNTFLHPGQMSPEDLLKDIGEGLLITEMFGPSLNANTGEYSVGVSGFAVENGARAYPTNEITIAGNLLDVYRTLRPANDLIFDSSTVAPSVAVEGLTIAGR